LWRYEASGFGHRLELSPGHRAGSLGLLCERCFRPLAERGMLLIGEFVPNDDRSGPPIAMLFGLNMLLHTPAGDVFTMKDYREWLKGAGFRTIKTIRTPWAVSALILAGK
jgi:3-hydroxy-5-methyl-1-naphthoate 3-O-methyltransferase